MSAMENNNPSTSKENPPEPEKKGDINTVLDALREIQKKAATLKPSERGVEKEKFDELLNIVEELASPSVNNDSTTEILPSKPKRRKLGKAAAAHEQNKEIDKDMEETKKRIDLLRRALDIFYELDYKDFLLYATKIKKQKDTLTHIDFLRRIREHGLAMPLFVKLDGEEPPPLCGSIRPASNYIPQVGDLVAALPDGGTEYMLAEVLSCTPSKKEYVVNDVYDQIHVYSFSVVPLPKMRADPESCPDALYSEGQAVYALFPDTSSFFAALVLRKPFGAHDPYQVQFLDDNQVVREAHQRYVIPIPREEELNLI